VLVTATLADAIALRAFNLVAAPVTGLGELNGEGVRLLGRHFGVERVLSEWQYQEQEAQAIAAPDTSNALCDASQPPATSCTPTAAASEKPPVATNSGDRDDEEPDYRRLTFVAWSVLGLANQPSAAIQTALDYLDKLAEHRGLDVTSVSQWQPNDEQIAAIEFALSRREFGWVHDAMLDSLHDNTTRIVLLTPRLPAPPIDLAAEIEKLFRDLSPLGQYESLEEQRQALRRYVRLAEKFIGVKLIRQAESANDPLKQSLLLQANELHATFLAAASGVRQRLLTDIGQTPDDFKSVAKLVSALMTVSRQIVALIKELQSCP
jgi:hypothetical protein